MAATRGVLRRARHKVGVTAAWTSSARVSPAGARASSPRCDSRLFRPAPWRVRLVPRRKPQTLESGSAQPRSSCGKWREAVQFGNQCGDGLIARPLGSREFARWGDHPDLWRCIRGNIYEMVKTNQLAVQDRRHVSARVPRKVVEKV
jgi:hypothetical protein